MPDSEANLMDHCQVKSQKLIRPNFDCIDLVVLDFQPFHPGVQPREILHVFQDMYIGNC